MHIFGFNYKEHKIDIEAAVEKMVKRINDMDFSYVENEIGKFEYKILTDIEQSKREYIQKVEEVKKHIVGGAIMQTGLAKAVGGRIMKLAGGSDTALFLLVVILRHQIITIPFHVS